MASTDLPFILKALKIQFSGPCGRAGEACSHGPLQLTVRHQTQAARVRRALYGGENVRALYDRRNLERPLARR